MRIINLFILVLLSLNLLAQEEVDSSIHKNISISYKLSENGEWGIVGINDESNKIIDTLLLIDGEVEILDYLSSGLDTISIIFSHIYRTPKTSKSVYYMHCTLDRTTNFYKGDRVLIFNHREISPSQKLAIETSENYCRNLTLIDHYNVSLERQIKVGINTYISDSVNVINDVKIVKPIKGISTGSKRIVF